MIRGWHSNGDVCHSQTCGLSHRPPLGVEQEITRHEAALGVAQDPDGTVRIQRRTPEDRERYLREKRAELVAAGKLAEAEALDVVAGWDVHTVVDGAGESSDLREDRDTEAVWAYRAAEVAEAFHEAYERLAPDFGYRTREASAKPWREVPAGNKALMVATAADLLRQGVIR